MSDNPLRDLLNERRWKQQDLDDVVIIVRHRGAEHDERSVPGHAILEVGGSGLGVEGPYASLDPGDEEDWDPAEDDEDGADGLFIPWHRVLRVMLAGAVLWERS